MLPHIEIQHNYLEDYLSSRPDIFKDQDTRFCIIDVYGSLFIEGSEKAKPIYYFG